MKKEWNAPAILDLTIQATAHRGGRGDNNNGFGDSNVCRCEGGTSPCEFHTHFSVTPDTLS